MLVSIPRIKSPLHTYTYFILYLVKSITSHLIITPCSPSMSFSPWYATRKFSIWLYYSRRLTEVPSATGPRFKDVTCEGFYLKVDTVFQYDESPDPQLGRMECCRWHYTVFEENGAKALVNWSYSELAFHYPLECSDLESALPLLSSYSLRQTYAARRISEDSEPYLSYLNAEQNRSKTPPSPPLHVLAMHAQTCYVVRSRN